MSLGGHALAIEIRNRISLQIRDWHDLASSAWQSGPSHPAWATIGLRPIARACASGLRRQKGAAEIPMPCIAEPSRARILKRFVLQSAGRDSSVFPVLQQERNIGRNKMCHGAALPDMSMEPEPSGHRIYHPVTPPLKLPIGWGPTRATHESDSLTDTQGYPPAEQGQEQGSHSQNRWYT